MAWETQRALPESMRDSGEGWEKAVHMPSGVAYVTQKHLVFVKGALTYLALGVVRWGGKRASGKGGRNEGERVLGKASMGLK